MSATSIVGLEQFLFIVTLLIYVVIESIQRAYELAKAFGYQMKVYRSSLDGDMAEKVLDGVEIGSMVEQVCSEAVPKRMYPRAFG